MRKLSKLMLIFLCAWAFNACAASFDCKKATSNTEKMICADIELSASDEYLAVFYKRAMAIAPDQNRLKQEQRAWLREVALCKEPVCARALYYSRISALADYAFNNVSLVCAKKTPDISVICSDSGLQQQYGQYIELYKTQRNLTTDNEGKWRLDDYFHKTISKIESTCADISCLQKQFVDVIELAKWSLDRLIVKNTYAYMPKWKPKLIASSLYHTCVAGDEVIKCWGTPGQKVLEPPRKFKGVTQLVSHYPTLSCAKDSFGWECWGSCRDGACDIPSDMKDADKLAVAQSHVCGLKNEKIKCWGLNSSGESNVPDDLPKVIDVAVSPENTCVALIDGNVRCWGDNRFDQVSTAVSLSGAQKIYSAPWYTCIENIMGHHECTDIIHARSYKKGGVESQSSFLNKNKFVYFYAGMERVCGISQGNNYACWPAELRSAPSLVVKDQSIYAVTANDGHTCILSHKNGISCWGSYPNEDVKLYKFPYDAKETMLKALKNE